MQKSGKSCFPKMRRCIQKTFATWQAKQAEQFLVPLHFLKRTDRCLDFCFKGLNPALTIFLSWEIGVGVDWQGENWDFLIFFETVPEHKADGYHCSLCIDEYAQITYSSREDLWQDHLFQPFLEWFNEYLVPARWLGLYKTDDKGCTWAKLLNEPDPEAFQLLPVWCLNEK
jgi:hypothetical protein